MNEAQVTCIRKDDRYDAYSRIERIGECDRSDGQNWTLSLDEAIAHIEAKRWQFFTYVGGHKRYIRIAVSAAGRKYLRTEADRDTPDNLLSLAECTC